jgi:hypothetical protein
MASHLNLAPSPCARRAELHIGQTSVHPTAVMRHDAGMGDKGGKKDKEKNKQQQLRKHKEEEQKKQDKARPKTS